MAPSRKTQSAPNRTATNLMKALKRNKSVDTTVVNKEEVKPCSNSSSPTSAKKKAISTNLQQKLSKTKKRKRVDQPVSSKEEGLKLLKRGAVTMHRIVRRKMLGIKYTVRNHWVLTAVNPESQLVYHMDPLKRRIATEEWTEVVDNAIKLYKEKGKKILKKKIIWENLAGVPLQSGSKDCGLFLMRYMKEICLDKELKFVSKWLRRGNLAYGANDLNEIRTDWAKYFMKHHAR